MKPFSLLPTTHLRPADFSRLASGDLSEREAQTLRRHLSTCAKCRTKWQSVQIVWQAAQAEQARLLAAPPNELRGRIFAALPTSPARPERKPFMLAFLFARPVVGASLAAAATVFVGVGALTYGPALVFHGPRAVAFEDVEAAMGGIKTATWTTETIITFPPSSREKDKRIQHRPSENFAQVSPPRLAIRIPAYKTNEVGDGQSRRMVYFGKYALMFTENGQNFYKYDGQILSHDATLSAQEAVRRAVLFPRELLNTTPPTRQKKLPYTIEKTVTIEQTPWTSAPDTMNGKNVVRLQNRVTRTYPTLKRNGLKPYTRVEENTIWADADTYRIMRREQHQLPLDPDASEVKIVFDNYRYNVALPKGVFDVPTPPVGVPFIFHDLASLQSWRGSPAEHAKIKATLERAARLWNAKKTNALFQNWDFGFNRTWGQMSGAKGATPAQIAEEKHQWFARAEKGVPYRSWQLQNFKVASQQAGGIYVREKASDPFPPTGNAR